MYEKGGELALKEISRRKPILKNRVAPEIENAVIEMAIENPAYGQVRIANELTKRGQFVSPTGVRSVWVRNDLQTFARRLKALEARLARVGACQIKSELLHIIATEEEVAGAAKPVSPSIRVPLCHLASRESPRFPEQTAFMHAHACETTA